MQRYLEGTETHEKFDCKRCEHAEDLRGCASKHVGEARRLLSEGDAEAADHQLDGLEKHLKKN